MKPAINDDFPRCLFFLVVALHHVVPVQDQLTDFTQGTVRTLVIDDADLHTRDGRPDGTGLLRAVRSAQGADRRGFGQAVALDEGRLELFIEFRNVVRGHGRSASDAESKGTDVVLVRVFIKKHSQEQTGDGGDERDLFPADELEDFIKIERVHQNEARADPDGAQHVRDRSEGMEKRNDRKAHVGVVDVTQIPQKGGLRDEIALGQDRAQRFSREAGGVNHDGGIVVGKLRHIQG